MVLDMVRHAFDNYILAAFPKDELAPLSGKGRDTLGGYALTLIDSLDLLAIVGMHDEFRRYGKWVQNAFRDFDLDVSVSVFETHIRLVGGLLSAHFMYEEGIVEVDPSVDAYDGGLLRLAVDLARRLLPAFNTRTGIPFGAINLRKGVAKTEIDVTSTAGAGTFLLENTIISAVTGNASFERYARRASESLLRHRSAATNLVGNHINISSGEWTLDIASVGSGVDSFIEYLFKAHVLTGDPLYWEHFRLMHHAVLRYCRKAEWYVDVNMNNGAVVFPIHNSLASFYPGMLATAGFLPEALEPLNAQHSVFKRYGAMPEGYHLNGLGAAAKQEGYPLRPEHAESLYLVYRATRDVAYLLRGKEVVSSLLERTATGCGFAALKHCVRLEDEDQHSDTMESFMLSETLKYLYLLFSDDDHFLHRKYRDPPSSFNLTNAWVFNTEGHPLPVTPEWSSWVQNEYRDRFEAYEAALEALDDSVDSAAIKDHRCSRLGNMDDVQTLDGIDGWRVPVVDGEYRCRGVPTNAFEALSTAIVTPRFKRPTL